MTANVRDSASTAPTSDDTTSTADAEPVPDIELDDSAPDGQQPTPMELVARANEDAATDPLQRFRHREVVVKANGFVYRGVFVGADANEVYLRGNTQHIVLPMEHIRSIELVDVVTKLNPHKHINAEFYQQLEGEEPASDAGSETDTVEPAPGTTPTDDDRLKS